MIRLMWYKILSGAIFVDWHHPWDWCHSSNEICLLEWHHGVTLENGVILGGRWLGYMSLQKSQILKNNHFQPSQKSLCHKIECLKIDSLKVVTLKYSLFVKASKIFYERRCLRRLHKMEKWRRRRDKDRILYSSTKCHFLFRKIDLERRPFLEI